MTDAIKAIKILKLVLYLSLANGAVAGVSNVRLTCGMSAVLAAVIAVALQPQRTTGPHDPVTAPPKSLAQDGFYTKCVYFDGLPIIASAKVDDRALHGVVFLIGNMVAKADKRLIPSLVKRGSHFSIIGKDQGQTDLPEYADLRHDPNTDWNKRARGLGGLVTSCGEENLLELDTDRYRGESICVHEFSHTLASEGFSIIDPTYRRDLRAAFKHATESGLWKNTYSATNEDEYWAEGVQAYFDCCQSATPPNGVHNEVANRKGLEKYDPMLFRLVDRCFGSNPWRYEGKYNSGGASQSFTSQ